MLPSTSLSLTYTLSLYLNLFSIACVLLLIAYSSHATQTKFNSIKTKIINSCNVQREMQLKHTNKVRYLMQTEPVLKNRQIFFSLLFVKFPSVGYTKKKKLRKSGLHFDLNSKTENSTKTK